MMDADRDGDWAIQLDGELELLAKAVQAVDPHQELAVRVRDVRALVPAALREARRLGEIEGQFMGYDAEEVYHAGQQDIIARLSNPDETLVEAVANAIRDPYGEHLPWEDVAACDRNDYLRAASEVLTALSRDAFRGAASTMTEREKELMRALQAAINAGKLLQQNSISCAIKHHGLSVDEPLPGWLRDTRDALDAATEALRRAALSDTPAHD